MSFHFFKPSLHLACFSLLFTSNLYFAPKTQAEEQASTKLEVNEKKVPDKRADLFFIQEQLQKHLQKSKAATVSLTDGQGFGSGVIVNAQGLIMTAAHVSAGVNRPITVILEDGTKLPALTLGLDSDTDAALVQIEQTEELKKNYKNGLPHVEINIIQFGKNIHLGDWVYSLGHSGGFDLERGSVVRLGRVVRFNAQSSSLQTDGSLIGGDSGGPLFDLNGKLIGIHSRVGMVVDQNMHVASYAFFKQEEADKKNQWNRMLECEFIGKGPFATKPAPGTGFMGFALEEKNEQLKVSDIDEHGVAHRAGLKIGDQLLKINDTPLKTKKELREWMQQRHPGDKITLHLLRTEQKNEAKQEEAVKKEIQFRLGKR